MGRPDLTRGLGGMHALYSWHRYRERFRDRETHTLMTWQEPFWVARAGVPARGPSHASLAPRVGGCVHVF